MSALSEHLLIFIRAMNPPHNLHMKSNLLFIWGLSFYLTTVGYQFLSAYVNVNSLK